MNARAAATLAVVAGIAPTFINILSTAAGSGCLRPAAIIYDPKGE
jgi:hypothetical protein